MDNSSEQGFRDDLREFLKEHGFNIAKGTLNKICAPDCDPALRERYNGGPPIAGLWPVARGRNKYRPIYNFAESLNWARSLLLQ
jgi:hypothetical protein